MPRLNFVDWNLQVGIFDRKLVKSFRFCAISKINVLPSLFLTLGCVLSMFLKFGHLQSYVLIKRFLHKKGAYGEE